MSENSISKFTPFDTSKLVSDDYFSSFVSEAENCGETDSNFTEKTKMSCLEVLAEKCNDFTGGESTSVRAETAENIMKSMFFCLDLYMKNIPDENLAIESLKTVPVRVMYLKGKAIADKKIKIAKMLFAQTYKNAIVTDNYAYNATLLKGGLYKFFKFYNADYAAHEIPASIDYPLANPVTGLSGVEYIVKYLQNLYNENVFCSYFDEQSVSRLLNGYDSESSELLVNIFEIVLTQCIGCILANKNPFELYVSENDVENLQRKLKLISREDRIDAVLLAYKALAKGMGLKSKSLLAYCEKTVKNILQNLFHALKTDTLGKMFIVPKDKEIDGEFLQSDDRCDDDEYSVIAEMITQSGDISEKIQVIKSRVTSISDLEDLIFDCDFSREEIMEVLRIIPERWFAKIMQNHPADNSSDLYDADCAELVLRKAIESCFCEFSTDKKAKIITMTE